MGLNVALRHKVNMETPGEQNAPDGQVEQLDMPEKLLKYPPAQSGHTDRPVWFPNVPVEQFSGTLNPPCGQNEPMGQVRHTVMLVWGPYDPLAHFNVTDCPVWLVNSPAGANVQLD